MAVEKPIIFLKNTITTSSFTSPKSAFGERRLPERNDQTGHASYLRGRFQSVREARDSSKQLTPKQVAAIKYKDGFYVEFVGQANCDLLTKSLEDQRQGVRLLNIRERDGSVIATVYIPDEKVDWFVKRLDKYQSDWRSDKGKRKDQDIIDSIEDVRLALLEAFWIGKPEGIPSKAPALCEVWLRADGDNTNVIEEKFLQACQGLEIGTYKETIRFPERIVKVVHASAEQLGLLIEHFGYLAEMRRAEESAAFFEDLSPVEQKEWVDDLLSRIEYSPSDASVCILDTGLNSGHPLLKPYCNDDNLHAAEPSWGTHDHEGHGTEMAGVALFHNLENALSSPSTVHLSHQLESVKILPPKGATDPKLYGAVTQNAVHLAEIVNPSAERAICMAVTEEDEFSVLDGWPSSWSGAIDSLVAGVNDEDDKRRLFFISAGNVPFAELKDGYTTANETSSVQSPGQAWNAITVGAYSDKIQITSPSLSGYHPIADQDQLSPFSTTSSIWSSKWPIKPEVLCDGGNIASDGANILDCADLSLLTTSHQPTTRLFSTINGTSSATAQAANMAAQIIAEYPGIWPETVRALLVHSAQWPEKMKAQFGADKDKSKTGARRTLLRCCGYGIPNLERAIQCLSNSVNLIIEGEIQPFIKSDYIKMNEMHLHQIPWPKEELQRLGEIPVVMRVTLSYFIEPGPGEIGWKDKYRYASCGLRFDVKNANESSTDFGKRINRAMREEKEDKGDGSSVSPHWYLGTQNRDVGSIHSDFREQSAVDLCDAEHIAIYPGVGWWKERSHLKCYDRKMRYSLIISISTPEKSAEFYEPIVTQIAAATQTAIEIKTP